MIDLTLRLTQPTGSDDITGTATYSVDTYTVSGKLSSGVLRFLDSQYHTVATFTGTFTPVSDAEKIITDDGAGTFNFVKRQ